MDERQKAALSFHAGLAVKAAIERLSPELSAFEQIIIAEELHSILYHAMCRAALEVVRESTLD